MSTRSPSSVVRQRVLAVAGPSGSGKTTLIQVMLPAFAALGWTVNVIKHSHHDVELEPAGKDSARFRQAGAQEVMISSPYRYAIMCELRGMPEPSVFELMERLRPADLTIIEGYHREQLPRIEVYRPCVGSRAVTDHTTSTIAIVSDVEHSLGNLPVWPLNQPDVVAKHLVRWFTEPSL